MNLILIVLIILLLFGGGGYAIGGPQYMGGGLGLVLFILVIVYLVRGRL